MSCFFKGSKSPLMSFFLPKKLIDLVFTTSYQVFLFSLSLPLAQMSSPHSFATNPDVTQQTHLEDAGILQSPAFRRP